MVNNMPTNARDIRDAGLILGQGQADPLEIQGQEDPLEKEMATHSSILAWRIPMDRGAWRATVHGIAKSRAQLSD